MSDDWLVKSLYSATPLVFNSPDVGVPLGRSKKFTWMSIDGRRTLWQIHCLDIVSDLSCLATFKRLVKTELYNRAYLRWFVTTRTYDSSLCEWLNVRHQPRNNNNNNNNNLYMPTKKWWHCTAFNEFAFSRCFKPSTLTARSVVRNLVSFAIFELATVKPSEARMRPMSAGWLAQLSANALNQLRPHAVSPGPGPSPTVMQNWLLLPQQWLWRQYSLRLPTEDGQAELAWVAG